MALQHPFCAKCTGMSRNGMGKDLMAAGRERGAERTGRATKQIFFKFMHILWNIMMSQRHIT